MSKDYRIGEHETVRGVPGTSEQARELAKGFFALVTEGDMSRFEHLEKAFRNHFPSYMVFKSLLQFTTLHLLGFVKFFDATLPEDDINNYYMEREWRVPGVVQFTVGDIRTIFLPGGYKDRFQQEVPEFKGEVHEVP